MSKLSVPSGAVPSGSPSTPPLYRKVGGLHILRLGRFRVMFCRVRAKRQPKPIPTLPNITAYTLKGV